MKKFNKSRIKFDVQSLEKLLKDEKSCLEKISAKHHLALHPFHLNDLNESIKDLLNRKVGKFHRELDGILFGYHNIILSSDKAQTLDDSCFIHLDIEADFYIFKPEIGKTLTGIVNKKSKDHVGCLVHKTFNVSLPKDDKFWLGNDIQLNSKVEFLITLTNFESSLPYIRGKLISIISEPEVSIANSSAKLHKKNKVIKFSDEEAREGKEDETVRKKKKKKKKQEEVTNSQQLESSFSDNSNLKKAKKLKTISFSENVEEEIEIPTKKSKKHKIKQENPEDSLDILEDIGKFLNEPQVLLSTSSKKKRKYSNSGDSENSPKKKKIKIEKNESD